MLNAIMSAFQDVKHPGNNHLLRNDIPEDMQDDMDIQFLYQYQDEPWINIDRSILKYEYACLSALSDKGLLYIIPCFLIQILNGDRDDIDRWCDTLLTVISNKGRGRLFLTKKQFEIIDRVFLSYIENIYLKDKETSKLISRIRNTSDKSKQCLFVKRVQVFRCDISVHPIKAYLDS